MVQHGQLFAAAVDAVVGVVVVVAVVVVVGWCLSGLSVAES